MTSRFESDYQNQKEIMKKLILSRKRRLCQQNTGCLMFLSRLQCRDGQCILKRTRTISCWTCHRDWRHAAARRAHNLAADKNKE
ncbi:unnamed protein product [Oikopleura dioica]|uniref:Uncharacterized protein n=1 Tax=Oikopleura dioica TaxID=34765 RepID=E4XR34_OIKDI|nr:unnamed protein product [Oikopleura dioica]